MKKVTLMESVGLLFGLYKIKSPRIFGISFEYRDNAHNRKLNRVGQLRKMTCTFHVEKYKAGGVPAYDPYEKRVFWVVDMDIINADKHLPEDQRRNPHRSIPWESIKEVRMEKEVYTIV